MRGMRLGLGAFLRSRQGNFAMMTAVTLPMLLGAVGFAIDIATLAKARGQLQSAADAAVLAASRLTDQSSTREEVFDDYLDANLDTAETLYNVDPDLSVEEVLNYIETRATVAADVRLYFPYLFGESRRITVTAGASESRADIEVAMVLDNTGSMGASRMSALRNAATALADMLEDAQGTSREVRAALVPFGTAVNVKGPGFKDSWIDRNAEAEFHGANFVEVDGEPTNHFDLFDRLDVEWKGCVEARPAPYNFSDDPPSLHEPDTLFVPYFAPDEPGDERASYDSPTDFNNTYLDDMVPGSHRERQRSIVKYDTWTPSHIDGHGPLTNGPNFACPTPIMPLTGDFDALREEIDDMIHWYGSGTNVSEGLAWGMRVLSPGEPYDQGGAFDSDEVSKAVVVFTDGENNVFGASSEPINKSDYGSYSFVDQGRMGGSRAQALAQVNEWTLDVCEQLKAEDVKVFTVLLGADTPANQQLYSQCASEPDFYFPTSDVNELEDIFRAIGNAVNELYVTH